MWVREQKGKPCGRVEKGLEEQGEGGLRGTRAGMLPHDVLPNRTVGFAPAQKKSALRNMVGGLGTMSLTEGGVRETAGGFQVRLTDKLPLVRSPEDTGRGEGFRSLLGGTAEAG